MEYNFNWAANRTKVQIAVQKLKSRLAESGKALTEENIKEEYIKMGGLVLKASRGRPKNDSKTSVEASKE